MRFLPVKQGTPEWLQARVGIPTASEFKTAIAVMQKDSPLKDALGRPVRCKGDPTGEADKYASDLAIERISGKPWGEGPNVWMMRRGHELEPAARLAYEGHSGNMAEEAGVCLTDDGRFGYSTDGMVNPIRVPGTDLQLFTGCEGLIEIKCPVDSQKILGIWTGHDISEYWPQMQGGMWITGAKWCDFVMYVPELAAAGRDLYVQRVLRDDNFITDMERRLLAFDKRVAHFVAQLGGAAANEAAWPFPKAA